VGLRVDIGMSSVVVRVDKKGRLVIPKKLREELGIVEECYVEISAEGDKIVLKPIKSIADEYFGVFKVEKWPKDLDEFLVKEVTKRWLKDT
jgi:AbrB family looped-hinge helix DNA binding protein